MLGGRLDSACTFPQDRNVLRLAFAAAARSSRGIPLQAPHLFPAVFRLASHPLRG